MNTADDEACNIAEKQDAQWLLWTCPDWLRTKTKQHLNIPLLYRRYNVDKTRYII